MDKQIELKPCPFCDGEVEGIQYSFGVVGVIACKNCKAKFVIPWNEATELKDLYNAWNRRVNGTAVIDGAKEREALSRLAELEDDLESGKIIRLPCKVGDIVYFPIVDRFDYAEIENIHITDKEIIFEWAQYDRGYELTEVWDDGAFTLDDIGKTVFLTREEAEKRLKELQE